MRPSLLRWTNQRLLGNRRSLKEVGSSREELRIGICSFRASGGAKTLKSSGNTGQEGSFETNTVASTVG
jgi:hypothetical protein